MSTDGAAIMERYLTNGFKYINLTPAISNLQNLMGTYTIKPGESFKSGDGRVYSGAYDFGNENPVVHDYIKNWIAMISHGRKAGDIALAFSPWLRRIASSYIALNPTTLLNQPAAWANVVTIVGPKHMSVGIAKAFREAYKDADDGMFQLTFKNLVHLRDEKILRGARRKSVVLPTRSFTAEENKFTSENPSKFFRPADTVADWGGNLIGMVDEYTAIAAWEAFAEKYQYDYKRKNGSLVGMKEQDLADYADDWTLRTQASGAIEDLAPIQYHTVGRAFTMLQTYAINLGGFVVQDVLELHKGKQSLLKKTVMRRALALLLVNETFGALYEYLFPQVIKGTTGWDVNFYSPVPTPFTEAYRGFLKNGMSMNTAWDGVKETFEYMPIGSSIKFGSNPLGPAVEVLGEFSRAMSGKGRMSRDERSELIVESMGRFYGWPVSAQTKITRWIDDNS